MVVWICGLLCSIFFNVRLFDNFVISVEGGNLWICIGDVGMLWSS